MEYLVWRRCQQTVFQVVHYMTVFWYLYVWILGDEAYKDAERAKRQKLGNLTWSRVRFPNQKYSSNFSRVVEPCAKSMYNYKLHFNTYIWIPLIHLYLDTTRT